MLRFDIAFSFAKTYLYTVRSTVPRAIPAEEKSYMVQPLILGTQFSHRLHDKVPSQNALDRALTLALDAFSHYALALYDRLYCEFEGSVF